MLDIETPARPSLTPHTTLRRVRAVVNPASGSVGPGAAERLQGIVDGFGLDAEVVEVTPGSLEDDLRAAIAAKPDLLIVLAGDGTIRAAGELCGPDGPLLAPLPGGTMNMFPKALYGTVDWEKALNEALSEGVERNICGGEVDGNAFYCAAILGHPALWAEAREAIREKKLTLAWRRAVKAMRRAFTGRLRYRLDGKFFDRAEAMAFITPLISKKMSDEAALEAATMDPQGALDAFRMAFNYVARDWRDDPAVQTRLIRTAVLESRRPIPAILDGEPLRLGRRATVRFTPKAFRALAPRLEETRV